MRSPRANSGFMSAAVDMVQTRSLSNVGAEADGGGVVVPLPTQRLATPPAAATEEFLNLGPLSPELALVDPELARVARARLPDRPRAVAAPAPLAATPVTRPGAVPRPHDVVDRSADREPVRRRFPVGRVALAGCVGFALLLALPVLYEWWAPPQRTSGFVSQPTPSRSDPGAAAPAGPAQTAAVPAPSSTAQTFVWMAVPETESYEFQLFRGDQRVFRARVTKPRLALPASWRQGSGRYELTPGSYRWYVWPVSKRTKRQAAVAVVQARLVIEEPPK